MNREEIFNALFLRLERVQGMKIVTRRIKLWSEFTPPDKPCLCISQRDNDYVCDSEAHPAVVTLYADLFIYNQTKDKITVPAIAMNKLMDAVDFVMRPDNMVDGKLTLGGLVSHCWIEGKNIVETGDIDGDGIAVMVVKMLVPM